MNRPRVGFLGVGWIGRHRMQAMIATGAVEAVAIVDPSSECLDQARALAPGAAVLDSLDDLLAMRLDGVVIATPSAAHAQQAIRALDGGCAVFCQKPLGRDAAEAQAVVDAARRADRLLSVDLSYRFTEAASHVARLVRSGSLGTIRAVDLVFHNAYGPDKPWFYDRALAGGGCLIDLGVHLVDLALWVLDFPEVKTVSASLQSGEQPFSMEGAVEDFAVATLELVGGTIVRIACSWRLQAGRDAVIEASFFGTAGGVEFHNVGGSFYDFAASALRGTQSLPLCGPPDDWGGRAAADWAIALSRGNRFHAAAKSLVDVPAVLDRIYDAACSTVAARPSPTAASGGTARRLSAGDQRRHSARFVL